MSVPPAKLRLPTQQRREPKCETATSAQRRKQNTTRGLYSARGLMCAKVALQLTHTANSAWDTDNY
jgi:hypothetical protein